MRFPDVRGIMAGMSSQAAPPARSARVALAQLGAFGLVGAAISGVHLATGLGIPCPFLALTGWLCPLCGGTRTGSALLRGDLAAAWHANPLLLVVALLLAVRAAGWAIELVRQPRATVGQRWVPWSIARHATVILGVVGVVYTVARNLL